jgi:hypothetical protein
VSYTAHAEHADNQMQSRAPTSPPLDGQHYVTRLTDTFHVNLNNRMGFNQGNVVCTLDYAQSPNKEKIDSILDGDNHSTNETPTNKDAATETNPTYQPPSSAQFIITVETNKEGVVVLDGKLIPYILYEEWSQCRTRETVLVLLCAYFSR